MSQIHLIRFNYNLGKTWDSFITSFLQTYKKENVECAIYFYWLDVGGCGRRNKFSTRYNSKKKIFNQVFLINLNTTFSDFKDIRDELVRVYSHNGQYNGRKILVFFDFINIMDWKVSLEYQRKRTRPPMSHPWFRPLLELFQTNLKFKIFIFDNCMSIPIPTYLDTTIDSILECSLNWTDRQFKSIYLNTIRKELDIVLSRVHLFDFHVLDIICSYINSFENIPKEYTTINKYLKRINETC